MLRMELRFRGESDGPIFGGLGGRKKRGKKSNELIVGN